MHAYALVVLLAGNEHVRIFGTIETADEFLLLGHFVTSGAYKTRSFARFKTEKPNISKGSFRHGT